MDTKAKFIVEQLDNLFPAPQCELNYKNVYQLLVAVILSAQCTDKRVNVVTKELFKEFDTPQKIITLSQSQLEEKIHSCGFYHNKAKNILSMSRDLIEKYNGEVPNDLELMQTLAGVGRKTANVVYSEAFGGEAIAVDTHVLRVSNRLNLATSSNPYQVEKALMQTFDKKLWGKLHLQLVLFGRYVCKAKNPNCSNCPFTKYCEYYAQNKHNM